MYSSFGYKMSLGVVLFVSLSSAAADNLESERSLLALILNCSQPGGSRDAVCPDACRRWPEYCYYAVAAENGVPGTCKLPPYPSVGDYSIEGIDLPSAGDMADFTLRYTCPPGYKRKGYHPNCVSGTWSADFPSCTSDAIELDSVEDPTASGHLLDYSDYSEADPEIMAAGIIEDVAGDIGGPVRIRCLAYGYPAPAISWFHGRNMVPYNSAEYEVRGNNLLIKSLSIDTMGKYTCMVYNGQGPPESRTVVVRAFRRESSWPDSPYWLQHGAPPAPRTELPRPLIRRKNTDTCGMLEGADPLIMGGEKANMYEIPWHASIYDKSGGQYKQICGGSLVSHQLVISAAHCFWDDLTHKLWDKNYAVALGQRKRQWNSGGQLFNVSSIQLPPSFDGENNLYQGDIALVFLDKPAAYLANVRPVCLDLDDRKLDQDQTTDGKLGKVAVWEVTAEHWTSSDDLNVNELPTVSNLKCRQESGHNFKPYIGDDKLCAGKLNRNSLCPGDSGAGLVFREGPGQPYYLRGIASIREYSYAACEGYTIFTRVFHYADFITNHTTGSL